MEMKTDVDGGRKDLAQDLDCSTLERMTLSELLYQVLTGEGSPFRIGAAAPRAA